MEIIIGNSIALIASILKVYTGYLKEKKRILLNQIIESILFIISNLVLKGITGAITSAINIIRNALCYKNRLNNTTKVLLITASLTLSILFNNLGFIGFLPAISTIIYILFMNTKDIIKFKFLIVITLLLWLVYDIYLKSYTSSCFNFMSIISNIIALIQIKKGQGIKND